MTTEIHPEDSTWAAPSIVVQEITVSMTTDPRERQDLPVAAHVRLSIGGYGTVFREVGITQADAVAIMRTLAELTGHRVEPMQYMARHPEARNPYALARPVEPHPYGDGCAT